MKPVDWNLMRAFAATAEEGSLSAGARRVGLTQPTLSRQIVALEAELGVPLFDRIGKRLVLNASGLGLLPHARTMMLAADALSLAAAGRSQAIEGEVSISASDGMAAFLLPDMAARIRREAPGVDLRIIATNALSDLRRREADIAIRHVRPKEPELIGRLVCEKSVGFYASRIWAERNRVPVTVSELAAADLIGFAPTAQLVTHLAGAGIDLGDARFPLASENGVVVWEMVRRGLGIGIMMDAIAARAQDVVRILPELNVMRVPVWLVSHQELRTSPRVRRVADILAEELAQA
jgi:DNA-binding transcriptional LysR family regulator